ncbi:unnamed protein product [Lymnaea stagnalis]|uniref:Chitin-binding type-2 domain-containing protein n=1 Tax=Lymnaea stagnalis TaxID=6523 RepID=A0AAV2I075_LYMST
MLALVAANAKYGAGSAQYGAGSAQYGAGSAQYGAGSAQYGARSAQYGAGSAQYGAGSAQYDASNYDSSTVAKNLNLYQEESYAPSSYQKGGNVKASGSNYGKSDSYNSAYTAQPSAYNAQPSAYNAQPSAYNAQPSAYNAQASSYGSQDYSNDADYNLGQYPCGPQDEGKTYAVVGLCYGYYECYYGESLYRQCNNYYSFDAYSGKCVADNTCAYVAPSTYDNIGYNANMDTMPTADTMPTVDTMPTADTMPTVDTPVAARLAAIMARTIESGVEARHDDMNIADEVQRVKIMTDGNLRL